MRTYGQIVSAVATISMTFFPSISGNVPGVYGWDMLAGWGAIGWGQSRRRIINHGAYHRLLTDGFGRSSRENDRTYVDQHGPVSQHSSRSEAMSERPPRTAGVL